jgi:hypothetical protein
MEALGAFALWFLGCFVGLVVGVALFAGYICLGMRIVPDKLPPFWYATFVTLWLILLLAIIGGVLAVWVGPPPAL